MRYEYSITVWVDANSEEEADEKIAPLESLAKEIDCKEYPVLHLEQSFVPYR